MTTEPPPLYCANHPSEETTLRCNRCEKPICSKCAIGTPTGYRCPECIHGQQKSFDTTNWYDYPLAFALAASMSFLGSRLVSFIGFFTLLLAPIAGYVIAEVIRFAVSRRRSKRLYQLSAIATASGSLIPILLYLVTVLFVLSQGGSINLGIFFPLLWQGVYAFLVTSSVLYRLGGMRI